jgi:alpha-L-fucosidase 2
MKKLILLVITLLSVYLIFFKSNVPVFEAANLTPAQIEQGKKQRLMLWYNEPATDWMTEALPIGNGYMGAMFFGGVEQEHIQFNEETLWNGGKGEWDQYRGGNRKNAHKHLPKIRALLAQGQFEQAHELANKELTGEIKAEHSDSVWEGFGAYQNFADVFIDIDKNSQGEVKNYRRQLAIDTATATVSYQKSGVNYQRQYFASYPKRTIVMHFTSDATQGSDYRIKQTLPHKNNQVAFSDNTLVVNGALENNNMGYESRLFVETATGEVSYEQGYLVVKNAKALTLYLTAATDYVNEYPNYTGRDYVALNSKTIAAIKQSDYLAIKAEHQQDFSGLFNRVSLTLDQSGLAYLPTKERLQRYQQGQKDNDLEALYFQYGRYLLTSASRPGSMPSNLQ